MAKKSAAKKVEEKSYDEVPYASFAYPQTHPNNISTIATLFGLKAPNFKKARVLELGCAGGGNITPMAYAYPDATFVGVDLSGEQIKQANDKKEALGLKNVEFLQQDVLDMKSKGKKDQYDYIICHGMFSWVPDDVRTKLLEVCNEFLSPNGIAVVSYNALPGWNAVRSLREMMLYHTNRFENPDEKVNQARLFLEFLSANVPAGQTGYKAVIDAERETLQRTHNMYMYHDHLEAENKQFYLSDFVTMARGNGLEYVGDAALASMYIGNMPADVMEKLQALNDIVAQEQYMDFITNRRFRTSILCKQDRKINRNLDKDQIMDYHLTFNPNIQVEGTDPNKDISFKIGGGNFTTHDPIANNLFLELAGCGSIPISADDLVKRVQEKTGEKSDKKIKAVLIANGLQLVLKGYINLHSDTIDFVSKVSKKPIVSPIARYEASLPHTVGLTNLLNFLVPTDMIAKIIVADLDGTNTKEDIAEVLIQAIEKGDVNINRDDTPLKDKAEIKKHVKEVVSVVLGKLAQNALLIG